MSARCFQERAVDLTNRRYIGASRPRAAPDLQLNRVGDYSGYFQRFGAWLIDAPARFAIGMALIYLPMRLLVFHQAERYASTDPDYLWRVMPSVDRIIVIALWLFAMVIFPWWYTALQECSTARATLGKRLLGLQVVDLKGCRVSFGGASARFFARLIPTFGLGYFMALFTRRRQTLYDLIAGCMVVRASIRLAATPSAPSQSPPLLSAPFPTPPAGS